MYRPAAPTPRSRVAASKKATRGGKGNSAGSKHVSKPQNEVQHEGSMPAPAPKKIGKLVIGIDLGTTRVAVATKEVLYKNSNETSKQDFPKVFANWPAFSSGGDYRFPSTFLYYKPQARLPLIGNALTLIRKSPSYEPSRMIRQLKMLFHDAQGHAITLAMHDKVKQQLQIAGKTPDEALHDLVHVIYDILFDDSKGNGSTLGKIYDHLNQLDFELVIAVPPGRSTVDHARVRQAFVQGPIKSTAVFVESEPAAMFRSWVYDGNYTRNWAVGKSFLIADIGGGTCCVVRLQLQRLKPSLGFKQVSASLSVPFGAETVSDAFQMLASSKVPQDWPDRDFEMGKICLEFETVWKPAFGAEPRVECKLDRSGVRNQWWEFSYDEIKGCFDVCLKEIILAIRKELKKGSSDFLILGGGLAENEYVQRIITENFPQLDIHKLGTGKEHVVVGSIMARLDEDFLVDFPIVRSKAFTEWIPVTEEIEKLECYNKLSFKQFPNDPETLYILGAKWVVKKDTQGAKVYEISSGDNINDAGERQINRSNKAPEFDETILTFNYDPGDDRYAYELEGNNETEDTLWINERLEVIPCPEHEEKITWSPWLNGTDPGFAIDDLDDVESKYDGQSYKILRYSIEMKVTETATSTWAKIWSSKSMKDMYGEVAFRSNPVLQEPVMRPQNISADLKQSFDIDTVNRNAINQARAASTAPKDPTPNASHHSPIPRRHEAAKSKRVKVLNSDDDDDDLYAPFAASKKKKLTSAAAGGNRGGNGGTTSSTPQKLRGNRVSRTSVKPDYTKQFEIDEDQY